MTRRRPFKLGLLLLALLLGGAIVNVTVAWSIMLAQGSAKEIAAANSQLMLRGNRQLTAHERHWYHAKEEQGFLTGFLPLLRPGFIRGTPSASDVKGIGWNATVFIEEIRGPGGRKSMIRLPSGKEVQAEDTGRQTFSTLSRSECGWPTRSLFILFGGSSGAPNMRRDSGWALSDCWGLFPKLNGYVVPVDPILPGFAINTIFYAAILWLLLFAPGAVRRTIRRRRGLCPGCAYPIGTSIVCTECGMNLPVPRNEARPIAHHSTNTHAVS